MSKTALVTVAILAAGVTAEPSLRGGQVAGSTPVKVITGTLYADNWLALYVNGKEVLADPLSDSPHNVMNVSFEVPCGEKVDYAIHTWDHMDDNRGLEYSNHLIGDGGLRFFFDDGTVSNNSWRCINVHFGPIDPQCCGYASHQEVKDLAKRPGLLGYPFCQPPHQKTCTTEDVNLTQAPFNWTTPAFDAESWGWRRAEEYEDDNGISFGIPAVYNRETGECGCDTCGEDKRGLWVETTPEMCIDFEDVDWERSGSKFIWTEWPAFDNRLYCRYTAPPVC